MIINGLGFVNKRLYLVSNFFTDKPIERLLGPDIDAAQLNDDRLRRALDEVYEAGLTPLFSQIAVRALAALNLAPSTGHMDTTTTSVLIYSALEYRIRTDLKQNDQTVPDQKNKPTQNPTARWIFEIFIGIHVLTLPDRTEMVLNLKPPQQTVIQLLGYDHFYS